MRARGIGMQSLNDTKLDLEWYFQRGEAECGFSSSQGHLLDQAKLGHFIHGHARDLFESEQMTANVRRYRTVDNRLKLLPIFEQTILCAAYASPETVRDVAVTLAAITPKAKELYGHSLILKICKRRASKTQKAHGLSRREWILLLCERAANGSKANGQLVSILEEARKLRAAVVQAYREVT